tara:strand:- start:389 stop:1165 length:777 start_codon:yes stop_codon:yes gene_type:complete
MKLDERKILENWNDLLKVINDNFSGERKDKLKEMYNYFSERMMFAPASGFEHLHNCFAGGYVDHVLRVIKCAEQQYNLWKQMGSDCDGYTFEELMFVALNHDLGKVGDLENDYYEPCTSEWHRKNQGRLYDSNKSIGHHMPVPHRSIFLLNHFGITMSQVEMIGIFTHDGLYDDGNKTYLMNWADEKSLKTNLPLVMHHADHMASRIEYENWKSHKPVVNVQPKPKKKSWSNPNAAPKVSTSNQSAQDMFKNLFGDDE